MTAARVGPQVREVPRSGCERSYWIALCGPKKMERCVV
jgi:hypothetical protein